MKRPVFLPLQSVEKGSIHGPRLEKLSCQNGTFLADERTGKRPEPKTIFNYEFIENLLRCQLGKRPDSLMIKSAWSLHNVPIKGPFIWRFGYEGINHVAPIMEATRCAENADFSRRWRTFFVHASPTFITRGRVAYSITNRATATIYWKSEWKTYFRSSTKNIGASCMPAHLFQLHSIQFLYKAFSKWLGPPAPQPWGRGFQTKTGKGHEWRPGTLRNVSL